MTFAVTMQYDTRRVLNDEFLYPLSVGLFYCSCSVVSCNEFVSARTVVYNVAISWSILIQWKKLILFTPTNWSSIQTIKWMFVHWL